MFSKDSLIIDEKDIFFTFFIVTAYKLILLIISQHNDK